MNCLLFVIDAVLELRRHSIHVAEDVGTAQVCVNVTSPEIECPLYSPSNATLTFSTISRTAGNWFFTFVCHY